MTEDELDTPHDFDSLAAKGTMAGIRRTHRDG